MFGDQGTPTGWAGPSRVTNLGRPGIVADWIIANIGRPNVRIDFPVGLPGVAVPGPGVGVPGLATATRTGTTGTVPPAIDRRDQPLNETNVSGGIVAQAASDWFDYHTKRSAGLNVAPPGTGQSTPPLIGNQTDMSADVGETFLNILSGAAGQWVNREIWGAPSPVNQITMTQPDTQPVAPYEMGGGLPGVDCIPEPPPNRCGAKPVWKYHGGGYKWVYPKRRRRRRLATPTDIKDLAALKGTLGNGKAMETWIATHSNC